MLTKALSLHLSLPHTHRALDAGGERPRSASQRVGTHVYSLTRASLPSGSLLRPVVQIATEPDCMIFRYTLKHGLVTQLYNLIYNLTSPVEIIHRYIIYIYVYI